MKSGSLLFGDPRLTFEDRDLVYAIEFIVLEDEAQPACFNRFVQKNWYDPVGIASDSSFRHGFPRPFVFHLELKVLNGITGFALPSGRKVDAAESLFIPQVNLQRTGTLDDPSRIFGHTAVQCLRLGIVHVLPACLDPCSFRQAQGKMILERPFRIRFPIFLAHVLVARVEGNTVSHSVFLHDCGC